MHTLLVLVLASANPEYDRALRLNDELRYAEAAKALDAALNLPGNDKAMLIQIYQLQGILLGTLNQVPDAVRRFRLLLSLAPDAKLKGDFPPRVTTAFFEARGALRDNRGISLTRAGGDPKDGRPRLAAVQVSGDPLKIVRAVRFHLRAEGEEWKASAVVVVNGAAALETNGRSVEWWAEALAERDVVIATLGDAANPLSDRTAEPFVAPVEPQPVSPPPPPPLVVQKPLPPAQPASTSALRIAGVASWAVAAGLLIGGGISYGAYSSANTAFTEGVKKVDADGVVIGLTQVEAYEHERVAKFNQSLSAGMLAGAAGAAVAGAVLFVLGAPSPGPAVAASPTFQPAPQVAVSVGPAAAGVSLRWALP